MTKKEILEEIGCKYTEKGIKRIGMSWLEKALELYRSAEDKEKAKMFIQQFVNR